MNIQSSINSAIGSIGSLGGTFVGVKALGKAGLLSQKQEQANQQAQQVIEAKKKQRRNFMQYLAKQPTSMGGTVGDLPPQMQKQIASQYTKSQRRTMMNRMDREANDGK